MIQNSFRVILVGHKNTYSQLRQIKMTNASTVLVTGATGYIAKHCIVQLLEQGYRVRGTVRSLARESELRQIFADYLDSEDQLEFVVANLLEDVGWDEALANCDYVLHTASPVPAATVEDESEIIKPALEGTKRVLNAALKAKVKRLVLTSSVAAISVGHGEDKHSFDESDWSNTDADIDAYSKSKTLAERAAWDFAKENPNFELAVINPSMVIGPLLDKRINASIQTVSLLMQGKYPAMPKIGWTFVDVRDVAAAHLAAMTMPEAVGQRFCCVNEFAWMADLAKILDPHFSNKGYRIPTRTLPNFFVRGMAFFDKTIRLIVPSLGIRSHYSNQHIKQVLDWQTRPLETSVVETAQSLIDYDLV
jgi:nucleoside-diphosphate-sugar epimerase